MTGHADVIIRYIRKYGDKIGITNYPPDIFLNAVAEMARVLDGDRKELLTDEEFGFTLPNKMNQ